MSKKNSLGLIGERVACDFITKKNFEVKKTNYYSRFGEIDIIAQTDKYIVFIEVKSRSDNYIVSPVDSITSSKKKKIIRTALVYMIENNIMLQPRFDVIEVIKSRDCDILSINHIENAFYQEDSYAIF